MKLPAKDSATWRALVTGLQTLIACLAALVVSEDFRTIVGNYYPQFIPTIASLAGTVSLLINFFRKDVDNY